jgi:peptidoglycan/xylan/chitin deacetylase (PgdA/CDA1 family)
VTTTLRQASAGSIVLAHDGGPEPNENLVTQLDRLIGGLKDDGFTFTTVSDLLAAPAARA